MTESEAIEILRFAYPKESNCPITEKVISIAINALDKQIPVKAVISGHNNAINTDVGCCPVCNHLPIRACDHNYCPNCGQKLNWESDEE